MLGERQRKLKKRQEILRLCEKKYFRHKFNKKKSSFTNMVGEKFQFGHYESGKSWGISKYSLQHP